MSLRIPSAHISRDKMSEVVMIITRYVWKLDPKRTILSNRYGSIQRDDLVWHFRGLYADDAWTRFIGRHPVGGARTLQEAVRMVEGRIARFKKAARRVFLMRAIGIVVYTIILVAIPTAIIFAWARSSGY